MRSLSLEKIRTPAFICNAVSLLKISQLLHALEIKSEVKVLYPLKPFSNYYGLEIIKANISGLSASSLFEAILARDLLGNDKLVHFTSPGLRPDEIEEIAEGEVKKIGNGGMILSSKKYIGRKVYVLIMK